MAPVSTQDRRQSKTLLKINERRSKIARNHAFNCRLSPVGRHMAIKNSVSKYFLSMSIVLTLLIVAFPVWFHNSDNFILL